MSAAIKFLINRGVVQPEICGEIDDLDFGIDQWIGKFSGDSMRQSEKHNLRSLGQVADVWLGELQSIGNRIAGKAREDLSERLAGKLARSDRDQFGVRMLEQPADEFLAGKARGPNDGDFDCVSLAHVLCFVRCFNVN